MNDFNPVADIQSVMPNNDHLRTRWFPGAPSAFEAHAKTPWTERPTFIVRVRSVADFLEAKSVEPRHARVLYSFLERFELVESMRLYNSTRGNQ